MRAPRTAAFVPAPLAPNSFDGRARGNGGAGAGEGEGEGESKKPSEQTQQGGV